MSFEFARVSTGPSFPNHVILIFLQFHATPLDSQPKELVGFITSICLATIFPNA